MVSEEKSKRRPGPGGVSVSPPKDIGSEIVLGALDKVKRTGKPIPSGSRIPPEAKKKAEK